MDIRTHGAIDSELCGRPVFTGEGESRVEFAATSRMAADDSGLIHGGFIFGAADYAAMIAVNHPNVVLGGADVRFLKPVRAGEAILFSAVVEEARGKKRVVNVSGSRGDEQVFNGIFTCFVPERHVLS